MIDVNDFEEELEAARVAAETAATRKSRPVPMSPWGLTISVIENKTQILEQVAAAIPATPSRAISPISMHVRFFRSLVAT